MRCTHISVIHRPWDTRIFYKECRALAQAGYETHLVIGGPATQSPIEGVHLHSLSDDPARPRIRKQWRRQARAARIALRLRPSTDHLHDPHLIPLGLGLRRSAPGSSTTATRTSPRTRGPSSSAVRRVLG